MLVWNALQEASFHFCPALNSYSVARKHVQVKWIVQFHPHTEPYSKVSSNASFGNRLPDHWREDTCLRHTQCLQTDSTAPFHSNPCLPSETELLFSPLEGGKKSCAGMPQELQMLWSTHTPRTVEGKGIKRYLHSAQMSLLHKPCKTKHSHFQGWFRGLHNWSTHHLPILPDHLQFVFPTFVLFLLLNATDYSPGGSSGTDHIFICNRQQVSFLDCQLHIHPSHFLHWFNHF